MRGMGDDERWINWNAVVWLIGPGIVILLLMYGCKANQIERPCSKWETRTVEYPAGQWGRRKPYVYKVCLER